MTTVHYEDVEMLHDPHESVKVQGGPGGGKTTYAYATLARILTSEQLDYTLESGTWVTYRRALADDTIETLTQTQILDESEANNKAVGRTRWISTLHAVCYRALDEAGELTGLTAATESDKRDFIETEYNTKYYSKNTQDTPQQAGMQLLDYAVKNNMQADEVTENCVHYERYRSWHNGPTPKRLKEDWEEYKDEHDLVDFSEMLVLCRDLDVTPPLDWLVFDEAHDAYPLMRDLLDSWSDIADIAIVMGDKNQVINTYEGASSNYFSELDLQQNVTLPVSHRVPSDVYDAARHTLKTHTRDNRVPEMSADSRTGTMVELQHSNIIERNNQTRVAKQADNARLARICRSPETDDVMILARTQRQIKQISGLCRWLGIPHRTQHDYSPGWSDEMLDLYLAICKIRWHKAGIVSKGLNADEIDALYNSHADIDNAEIITTNMRQNDIETQEIETVLEYSHVSEFLEGIESRSPISNTRLGEELSDDEMQMLERALRAPTQYGRGDMVDIKTIHASKGLQSETVILFDGTPAPNATHMNQVNDSEELVWYVALTRASEHCIVFRDAFDSVKSMIPRDLPTSTPSDISKVFEGGGA